MTVKFIHYGGQIIYAIYILKIFYGVNNSLIFFVFCVQSRLNTI
jgi:hypothetical protein